MKDLDAPPQAPMRPPEQVMRLARMGASFPTRLSFLRVLLRALSAQNANVTRPVWKIDKNGFGHAVYTVALGGHSYSLVAVSNDLPSDKRTDRVIAEAWDTAYVLYDGVPNEAEIGRICRAAPQQEAARFTQKDLVLSRANKSVRLFAHVVDALRGNCRLDEGLIQSTGYLMRTTAVYGNGKFGIADRARIENRPVMSGPFMAEMLTVWLIRGFTHDLVEHMGGVTLPKHVKRHLGIGNSTGLGMAPFLVSHPVLLDAWMQVRETALARVRAVEFVDPSVLTRLYDLMGRVAQHLTEWNVSDATAQTRIEVQRCEWGEIASQFTPDFMLERVPFDRMITATETMSLDTQELMVALVLEVNGALVDGLESCLASPFDVTLNPAMDTSEVAQLIEANWAWATGLDFSDPREEAQFWYVSEEKLEPRLGLRFEEEGADLESPLDIARQVAALDDELPETGTVAAFLRTCPQHRYAVKRVQNLTRHPYAEIRDNLISDRCLPIDMLRFKLSFFGAAKFDPKSDRWTRITLCQGAPLFDELDAADDWWLPMYGP